MLAPLVFVSMMPKWPSRRRSACKSRESCQRIQILFFIRQQFRMDRTVDVLPEKDKLTVNVCSIHDRTRGVTWAVNGCHCTATDSKGRFLALQSDIDGEWFEACLHTRRRQSHGCRLIRDKSHPTHEPRFGSHIRLSRPGPRRYDRSDSESAEGIRVAHLVPGIRQCFLLVAGDLDHFRHQ